ncbi:ABC1 family-domain-containing protein [Paraphysoderma sedebokerense]|nr:ABC1 family-domain-containing protein [Paraphysoderma sedebokerense]
MGEAVRRATGQSKPLIEGASPLLSEANIERIVAKLSEMRGAALKLGQIISIQDSNVMPKQIEELLSKVQNSANYMPKRQMLGVMKSELGPDWQSNFHSFDETPFAAASIGQVHSAIISEKFASYPPNFRVAVKLQYPGIANSIDSDLNNLKSFALFSGLLPKGMYLESAIQVARRELHWETDYKREAECMNRFRNLLLTGKQELDETTQLEIKKMEMEGDFVVPRVVDELSTGKVLTTEFVEGVTMGKVADMSQPVRDSVAIRVLRLCLRELFEFRFMQTDPNYANFLYEAKTNQIKLLDFGSTRSFSQSFTDKYIKVLEGAVKRDEQAVLDYSRQLGFLTGFETESMNQAHLTAVLTLAEPFRHRIYDFSSASSITSKVRSLIPTMLEHRLTPPPDETYSLHRKLSGLRCKIGCERVWWEEWERYENRKRELNNQNVS